MPSGDDAQPGSALAGTTRDVGAGSGYASAPMPPLVTVGFVVLLAAFTQGVLGFGFGMVAMAIVPWILGYRTAVALVAVFGLLNNVSLLWHYRRDFTFRAAAPLLVGGVVGAPLGALLVVSVEPHVVMRLLGAVLLLYATHGLVFGGVESPGSSSPVWALDPLGVGLGVAGGFLGAAFNTGGPPAIVYGTARRWPQGTFKAVLQGFFLVVCVLQLGLYASEGLLTGPVLRDDAVLAPVLALGLYVGTRLSGHLNGDTFRRLVLGCLVVVSVVYLVRA